MGKVTFYCTGFINLCDQVLDGGYRDAGFKSFDYLGEVIDGVETKVTVLFYKNPDEGTYSC